MRLVSLERGMGVPILSGEYKGQYDWLTHVFRYGGADLLLETIQTCFDVGADRYVRVNFSTFREVIDALDGIDLELTAVEAAYMTGVCGMEFEEGLCHVDGAAALQFARMRKPDSDWKRMERQREVIKSCMERAKTMEWSKLLSSGMDLLKKIETNLSDDEIAELILLAPGFRNAEIEQMTIPAEGNFGSMTGMEGRQLFKVDFEANQQILHDFLYETDEENQLP